MATIKSYSDLQQSKKLADILPLDSADMMYQEYETVIGDDYGYAYRIQPFFSSDIDGIPCWSLAALLGVLSEIKSQVYTPILFPSEGKWILQFAEYGHGNICEVTCDNPVDACYEMILKLHELDLV